METKTLSSGVSMQLGIQRVQDHAPGYILASPSEDRADIKLPIATSDSTEDLNASKENIVSADSEAIYITEADQKIFNSALTDREKSSADKLLQSAKEDKFEVALQRLANGEFDEEIEDVPEEVEGALVEERTSDEEKSEVSRESESQDEVEDSEYKVIRERNSELEQVVESQKEQLKTVEEKLKDANDTIRKYHDVQMLFLAYLQAKLEKAEDESERENILETMVTFTKFIISIFMPEPPVQQKEERRVEQPKKPSNAISLIDALKKHAAEKKSNITQFPSQAPVAKVA